jgi:YD repeat-containing protein
LGILVFSLLSYDGMNRMTNMVDGIGTTKYTYTAAGQLLTELSPLRSQGQRSLRMRQILGVDWFTCPAFRS